MKIPGWILLLSFITPAAAELADPTAPTNPALFFGRDSDRASRGWELNSVLIGAHRRVAMINGVAVGEGDRIGAARVLRIRPGEVELESDQRRIVLRLLTRHARRTEAAPDIPLQTLNNPSRTTAQPRVLP